MKILLCFILLTFKVHSTKVDIIKPLLTKYGQEVNNGKAKGVTSFIVLKNDKLLIESYSPTTSKHDKQDVRSVTKSITALLIGQAIESGIIPNEHTLVSTFGVSSRSFSNIKISDLLTMRTGLACDDWVPASIGNEDKMYQSPNWAEFFLALPLSHETGKHFSYCTGSAIYLGHILNNNLENNLASWANKNLFSQLNIIDFHWSKTPYNIIDTGGHLYIKPLDLAKFGQLILNNGTFKGRKIIPSSWIKKMLTAHTKVYERPFHYGFWWWLTIPNDVSETKDRQADLIFAWGNGGQYLFVSPKHQLIFVFTGTNYNTREMLRPQLLVKEWLALLP